MLPVVTSTSDELLSGVNIDDLEPLKYWFLVNFRDFGLQHTF